MVTDDSEASGSEQQGNVVIRTSVYSIVPFDNTRAVQNIADYCSTISYVFYQDGTRVNTFTQKKGEDGYGQLTTKLATGTYQVLILAHSCPFGIPTLTNPANIQFTNTGTGYSDTFFYYDDLVVTEQQNTYDLILQRATSMVRIFITDEVLPEEVAKFRVNYEGESGVLDATTGWGGSTNSKQYIMYDRNDLSAPVTLCAYTFQRNEIGSLTITVTAYDGDDNIVAEKTLKDVPLKHQMVTEYSGSLFANPNTDATINLKAETSWQVYQQLTF